MKNENEKRARVVAEAMTWLRTPYHKHGRVKGAGVDCSMLLAEVYEKAGIIARVYPEYAADWHLHKTRELYVEWLERFANEVTGRDPLPGDAVVWKFGRTFSHGAIVAEWPNVIQAYMNRPVELANAMQDEELRTRPMRVFEMAEFGHGW